MAFDYSNIATVAKTLVEEFGREVTLIRLDRTIGDADKPWRAIADPRAIPDATQVLKAVFVNPGNDLGALGETVEIPDNIPSTSKILIVAALSAPGVALETYDELLEGGEYFQMKIINLLKPGETSLIYFFEVINAGS